MSPAPLLQGPLSRGSILRGSPAPFALHRAALLLVALLLAPAPAAAQSTPAPAASDSAALAELASRHPLLAVSPHAHGTMVGVALRVPAGSAHDPPGAEGTAWLLAKARERQARDLLDPARATLSARVGRTATVYTLLATPSAWVRELERVEGLLFGSFVTAEAVASQRERLLESLRFQAGSPVEAFQREAAAFLVDPGDPWGTPIRGTPASVEGVGLEALQAWSEEHVRPQGTAVAVAGPLPAGTGAEAAPTPADTRTPESVRVPWRVGDRVALVQEVTSAWLSVAYPAPDTLPRTALELLAHLVEEELDPVPPDPDRYSVDVHLEETPRGPVLLVQASLLPEALARWEDRILSVVSSLGREPMDEDFFRWKRRRFRTLRLLAESAPEAEAARMSEDLALLGAARPLDREIWALTPQDLVSAARSLGEPRVLLLGPDLAQDGPDGAR